VSEAKQSEKSGNLLDIPFYMKGESHPKIVKGLGDSTSNRRTNAFGKSDKDACHIAFLSAIIALQERAKAQGGNAVVDIRSITRHNDLDSRDQYRCVAGAMVANVALTGRIVQLETKAPAKTETKTDAKPKKK
jgi:uncharacterized protein YbjQ (UPF0145 family)